MPFFGFLLMLTALVIAGVAGWFSVYGLASIFKGAFLSVVLMGGALEIGKLIATSYLYRYWAHTGWVLRSYLTAAILGLMLITSSGVFGYLSSAYQQDSIGIKDVQARIELLDKEYTELSRRETEIDADVNRVGSDMVSARMRLMKQYEGEKKSLSERRNVIRSEKLELASKQLEVEAHTGPIIYIAKALDRTVDDAVIWLSLLIIAVFDPLAVALTIAANSVMLHHKRRKEEEQPAAEPQIVEVIKEVPVEVVREVEVIKEVPVETVKEVLVHQELPDGVIAVSREEWDELNASKAEYNEYRPAVEDRLEGLTDQLKKAEQTIIQMEAEAAADQVEDQSRSRLELSQKATIERLNKEIDQAEKDLDDAIRGLESRETKIESLETTITELEQTIVELRIQIRKFELSATERAKLHQQNVAASKNSQ